MKINVVALIGSDLEFFHEIGRGPDVEVAMYRLTHHPDWWRSRSVVKNLIHWLGQLGDVTPAILFGRNVVFGTALVRALWPLFWWSHRFVWVLNELPGESETLLGRLDRLIIRKAGFLFVSSPERADYICERYGRVVEGYIPNLPHFSDESPDAGAPSERRGIIYSGLVSRRRFSPEALDRLGELQVDVDMFGHAVDDLSLDHLDGIRYHGNLSPDAIREVYADYAFGLLAYPTSDANNDLCAPIKIYEYLRYGCVCLSLNRNRGLVGLMKRYPALFSAFESTPATPSRTEFDEQRAAFLGETRKQVRAASEAIVRLLENGRHGPDRDGR